MVGIRINQRYKVSRCRRNKLRKFELMVLRSFLVIVLSSNESAFSRYFDACAQFRLTSTLLGYTTVRKIDYRISSWLTILIWQSWCRWRSCCSSIERRAISEKVFVRLIKMAAMASYPKLTLKMFSYNSTYHSNYTALPAIYPQRFHYRILMSIFPNARDFMQSLMITDHEFKYCINPKIQLKERSQYTEHTVFR